MNPASYDLTLGDKVVVYSDFTYCGGADAWDQTRSGPYDGSTLTVNPSAVPLDVRKQPATREWTINPDSGWVILPGVGYLLHTEERVWAEDTVPIVDGKSSMGRLFLQVHMTAGYGDAGFDGQYTLEVMSAIPVRVFPGMRICQIRFLSILGPVALYEGHYTENKALGPVASRVWEQMREAYPNGNLDSHLDRLKK